MSFLRKNLFAIPVLNFLIAAGFGLTLRIMTVYALPLNIKYFTHAHSHVAILGWVYLTLFLLFAQYFAGGLDKSYKKLFGLTEIAVIGMIISFPIQGYALFSIISSSLYIIFSYIFTFLTIRRTKGKNAPEFTLMRTSLFWLCLSTVSLWSLGPIMATLGSGSKPAQLAIQFFLHFQLNGWFLFAVLALIFNLMKARFSEDFKYFHRYFVISLALTFALPVNWYYDFEVIRWINTLGIVFQAAAIFYAIRIIKSSGKVFYANLDSPSKKLLLFASVSFLLKILFQSFSIFPEIAKYIFGNRQAVIGFIHLMMLGIVSVFLFFIIRLNIIHKRALRLFDAGIYFFLTGIVTTELILLYQGLSFYYPSLSLPIYPYWLLIFSFALLLGVCLILAAILKDKNKVETHSA